MAMTDSRLDGAASDMFTTTFDPVHSLVAVNRALLTTVHECIANCQTHVKFAIHPKLQDDPRPSGRLVTNP